MDLSPVALWHGLAWPLLRLLFFIGAGLLAANLVEAMNWTRRIAFLARPLIRFAHLSETAGASFSMAFLSGVSANTMLAEAHAQGRIAKRELILANLFNSLPTYFLHLPTTFCITAPLIKTAAFTYVGLTLGAAMLRTLCIAVAARFLLPRPAAPVQAGPDIGRPDLAQAWQRTWKRFRRRMRKIVRFTVPIYILFFFLHQLGLFTALERFMAAHLAPLSWLSPQALSVVVLHIGAEFSAGMAAAGALLQEGAMGEREIILALLAGNILSSPVRALRHQFPYYAGIFQPRLALELILCSQTFRLASIMAVTLGYALWPAGG